MEDDYPDGVGGLLAVGGSLTANIETAGDVDAFVVTLEAGEAYQFDVTGVGLSNFLFDPVLRLSNPSGVQVSENDDFGGSRDPRIEYTATSSGQHFLYVNGFGTGTGNFQISATQTSQPPITTFDDYPTGTSGSLSVGSSTFGNIETLGDTDAFTVLLEDGVTYRFDLSENSSQGGLTLNPFLQLTTSTGTVLTFDNDSGPSTDARIEFTPTFFGAYVLSAEGVGASTGLYEISATEVTTTSFDDYPSGTSGTVTVGGSTTGNIETSGDTDAFNVYLLGGYTYQFDLMGTSASGGFALSNPLLQLTDTSGSVFILNDNGGSGLNSRITDFTPQSSSFYSLTAQGAQGTTGVYEISATQTALPPTTPGPTTPGPTTPGPTTPGPTTPGPTEPTAPEYVQTIILLYEAALNRNGNYDWDGVNFWIDGYEGGTSYQTISRSFLNSPEFEQKFGEPLNANQQNYLSNDEFVNTMYLNVLDRSGDPSGLQYWNSVLQGNGNRESVLLNFARSPENFANNDDSLAAIYDASDGYWLI